jgi:hypothetical protein
MTEFAKIGGMCTADKEICERVEKLLDVLSSGGVVRSCKGRSAVKFRSVAPAVMVTRALGNVDYPDLAIVIISLSTGTVITLVYNTREDCIVASDVAFKYAENVTISHRLIMRS